MCIKNSKLKATILSFGMISLLIFNSYGANAKTTKNSYDINVSIKYKIYLGDKVKNVDPNIIRAARQGLFDSDCSKAKFFSHYKGYSVSYDVLIVNVKKVKSNSWAVEFKEKQHGQKDYIGYTNGTYSVVDVEKEKSGVFVGYVLNPGGPMIKANETY